MAAAPTSAGADHVGIAHFADTACQWRFDEPMQEWGRYARVAHTAVYGTAATCLAAVAIFKGLVPADRPGT
ncbi:hypothetical protein GCM10022233_87810 [Streptomyces shaanxiensis]|uniref:Uncharacterized protein n=1 Tax=Streptomyces shaanxiensis TaxID=653357 RepID=A0ABP7WKM5_9ACTN